MEKFRKLGLNEPIVEKIRQKMFESPTEIQEKAIPLVLEGKDLIAGSFTGSGKTLAFGLGIIQKADKGKGIQGLVLAPTRELAMQVAKSLDEYSRHNKLKIEAVYGGVSIDPQIRNLKSAEIVVGTPGRLIDHIERGTIDLRNLKTLVLDEADMMLDMGFLDDVEKIIKACPKDRQTLLFSATIPLEIEDLSKKHMNHAVKIAAKNYVDPKKLKQVYYDIHPDNLKFSLLLRLLKEEKAERVMIFCNTRRTVDFITDNLKAQKIESLPIHGGFTQSKRDTIMKKFHSEKSPILVCTDVAARGLDINDVTHVYNYDMCKDSKEYVHRAGRTARAGKEGMVISLISSRDMDNFRNVLSDHDMKIREVKMPRLEKVRFILRDAQGSRMGGSQGGYRGGPRDTRRDGYKRRDPPKPPEVRVGKRTVYRD
jgi:ATP-dependent RNA helicase DeaD